MSMSFVRELGKAKSLLGAYAKNPNISGLFTY